MVQAWKDLGFLLADGEGISRKFLMKERNADALGPVVKPGDRKWGVPEGVTSKKHSL